MSVRRITSAVILGAFLGLAVLSFLGDRVLASVFVVVAGAVLARHAVSICPRCSNLACGFNPRRAKDPGPDPVEPPGPADFSDLPITRTTVIPLLVTGPLAVIGAWRFSPLATVAVAAVALGAHTVFRHVTCSRCGNDCAGNCNPEYRAWKSARRAAGS